MVRGKALEDKRDFLEFLQGVQEVEAWIRLKVREQNGWMETFSAWNSDGTCLVSRRR